MALSWVAAWMNWVLSQVASLLANCSIHRVQRQKPPGSKSIVCMCTSCETSHHRQSEGFDSHNSELVGYRQQSTTLSDQTITDTHGRRSWSQRGSQWTSLITNMQTLTDAQGRQSRSQFIVGEAANEPDLSPTWCGRVFWHQWQIMLLSSLVTAAMRSDLQHLTGCRFCCWHVTI